MFIAPQKILILITLLFSAPIVRAQSWVQMPDFLSAARDDGTRFIIGNTAYCGTGYLPWFTASADFYAFNGNTQTWTTMASLPAGQERQYAVGFSDSSSGYVFGGLRNGQYLRDLWQYNPTQNTWSAGTPLPDSGRSGSACFVIDQTAYIIGGKTSTSAATNHIWAYNFTTQSWVQKNNFPFGEVWRGSGASQDSTGYLIFGKNANGHFLNTLYQYHPQQDSWSVITIFPEMGRSYSSLEAKENFLLIFGGMDSTNHFHNNFWRFDLTNKVWKKLPNLPANGRRGGLSFLLGNDLYYTTGLDSTGTRLTETWACLHAISLAEDIALSIISIFPNPAKDRLVVEIKNTPIDVKIYSLLGEIIYQKDAVSESLEINISSVPAGTYFVRVGNKDTFRILKWIKI